MLSNRLLQQLRHRSVRFAPLLSSVPPVARRHHAKLQCRIMATETAQALGPLEPRANVILEFWLGETYATDAPGYINKSKQKLWFMGGPELDKEVVEKFSADLEAVAAGEYDGWATPYDKLAAILVADQLSRNSYRGTAKMYSLDGKALSWAEEIQASGAAAKLPPMHRNFTIMPFMHSESLAGQQRCVELFEELVKDVEPLESEGLSNMLGMGLKYAKAHLDVVATWGRFPHRNAILGREDTPEEKEALAAGTVASF